MRIMITGGCGFLGSHLVEHFLKTTTAELVVLDKLSYASMGFDRLRLVREGMDADEFTRRVKMLTVDLSLPLATGVIREIGSVDYIIHAAAESHVDNSIVDPLPFLQSNVIGTHNLLWAVQQMPSVRRVFVVSTDEVYGPSTWREPVGVTHINHQIRDVYDGFDEDARFRPANPYAAAKAGGEMVAMAYANTYKLPITIVNTMNLIGERQHPEKFVPLVIRKVLKGETVHIHADPTRTRAGTRFYLHCRTFANALAWLVERDIAVGNMTDGPAMDMLSLPLKLHVCGEREISNLELAQIIAKEIQRSPGTASWGFGLKYELVDFHSSRPGHDLRYAMDDSAIREMGWERPMGLEQSLEKTVRWYLAHPEWLGLNKERLDDYRGTPKLGRAETAPVSNPWDGIDNEYLRSLDSQLYGAINWNGVRLPSRVQVILATIEGEHDGANWHWLVRLENGQHAYITGGCDYTGWDCQSNCEAFVEADLESALRQVPEAHIETLRSRVSNKLG